MDQNGCKLMNVDENELLWMPTYADCMLIADADADYDTDGVMSR